MTTEIKARKPPLACRPSKENESLYKVVAKEAKKRKISQSAYIEHCLIEYHNTKQLTTKTK